MTRPPRVTFFVDVDNTLLDNDAVKREMDRRMELLIGPTGSSRFWEIYEEVRGELTKVDIPLTLARFGRESGDPEIRVLLAELYMRFPFMNYIYPSTAATIAYMRAMGTVAILSDGDAIYQVAKISRSGLSAAVDGFAHVYAHKEDHLDELVGAFPAEHYVLVDDKPSVIRKVADRLAAPLTTVFVRQGRYAATVDPGHWSGAGLTIDSIGDLRVFDRAALIAAGRGHGG